MLFRFLLPIGSMYLAYCKGIFGAFHFIEFLAGTILPFAVRKMDHNSYNIMQSSLLPQTYLTFSFIYFVGFMFFNAFSGGVYTTQFLMSLASYFAGGVASEVGFVLDSSFPKSGF